MPLPDALASVVRQTSSMQMLLLLGIGVVFQFMAMVISAYCRHMLLQVLMLVWNYHLCSCWRGWRGYAVLILVLIPNAGAFFFHHVVPLISLGANES
ncbi:hypothetical protein Nepgr_033076 [Nepenthes gracilis]|uniref:Uncharacterized protein n=1 Tax=Nepenthes gracilis TaxID=150966 RepID=A0AAD3TJV6_NEPGR|nr:hypothetical protein Nepgr_033076 [Nepenthes gracilis]